MLLSSSTLSGVPALPAHYTDIEHASPRLQMAGRLPACLQPLLTWVTAQPAPGERVLERPPHFYLWEALGRTGAGVVLAGIAVWSHLAANGVLLLLGWILATSGLGFFQVVIFHHCAHGTVFRTREWNRRVGRLVSALLLFKYFDDYAREHMLHHSPRKLLTDEDEFADFIFGMCRLTPATEKRELWGRIIIVLFSPAFHTKFLLRRLSASLGSRDRVHNAIGASVWLSAFAVAAATDQLVLFLVAWVFPVTVLLQMATVLRILCEHRFPSPALIANRDKAFMCHATGGVFAGSPVPRRRANSLLGLFEWTRWWAEMLVVHLVTRLVVLVGDAPCHDFHHRHPASRKWTNYIHSRQIDRERGCPGFPVGYIESWGLFTAIDENLATLAATRPETLGMVERL